MKIKDPFNKLNYFCPECLAEFGKCNKYCIYCLQFRSNGAYQFIDLEQDRKRFVEIWKKVKPDIEPPTQPTVQDLAIIYTWNHRQYNTLPEYERINLTAYPYKIPFYQLPSKTRYWIIKNKIKKNKQLKK